MGRLLRIFWRWSLLLLLLLAVVAASEDLMLRYRIKHGAGKEVVDQVTTYDAAEQKSGRVEIYFDHPEMRECVHALFPHFGDPPCWYAKRQSVKLISGWFRIARRTLAAPAKAGRNEKRRLTTLSSRLPEALRREVLASESARGQLTCISKLEVI